jgi:hypothetical protein
MSLYGGSFSCSMNRETWLSLVWVNVSEYMLVFHVNNSQSWNRKVRGVGDSPSYGQAPFIRFTAAPLGFCNMPYGRLSPTQGNGLFRGRMMRFIVAMQLGQLWMMPYHSHGQVHFDHNTHEHDPRCVPGRRWGLSVAGFCAGWASFFATKPLSLPCLAATWSSMLLRRCRMPFSPSFNFSCRNLRYGTSRQLFSPLILK